MIPTLDAGPILLTPFHIADAPLVQAYAGDIEVARMTSHIPHPYPDGAAEAWIATHPGDYLENRAATFAIRARDGALLGAIGLSLELRHHRGEVGYWIARPFWGQGHATNALRALIRHGFSAHGLNRVIAHHFTENPASGRVMQKAGMTREGLLRQHVHKNGQYLDLVAYAILRSDSQPGDAVTAH